MAGHSKWAQIKRKKAVTDARRGKLFAKLIKEIAIAAREGGGDPDGNPRLRLAIQTAKSANMPQDNIQRAIQRGTGEIPGVRYDEIFYEGYGPGGVALFLESVTDNRNRTVAELRHILSNHGGRLGETGCVAWMFSRKGLIRVPTSTVNEEELIQVTVDAGADDIQTTDDYYEIKSSGTDIDRIKETIETNGITVDSSEIRMEPTNTIAVSGKEAEQLIQLLEALEEHDDVQNVYSNFEMDEEVMEKLAQNSVQGM